MVAKIKQHSFIALGTIIVLIALIAFFFAVYRFGWSGTGFLNKTLWDWLQLLIIPLALAVIALLFNLATTRRDQQIALDKQREDLLQTYLDRMSELLLKEHLLSSAPDAEVRIVARVRTTTILFQLDARRIGLVFAFLREARLTSTTSESIVPLRQADLRTINLSQASIGKANLSEANLSEADLSKASLYETNFSKANLSKANLSEAYLRGANLSGADLSFANLSKAYLSGTNLLGADLSFANFSKADLSGAYLSKARLSEAGLGGANLLGADLSEVDLRGADLRGAKITEEQLREAKSLEGAILPNGSKHS